MARPKGTKNIMRTPEEKEQIVLEKGLKIVDIDAIKKEKKSKYDFEKINKMLINNANLIFSITKNTGDQIECKIN